MTLRINARSTEYIFSTEVLHSACHSALDQCVCVCLWCKYGALYCCILGFYLWSCLSHYVFVLGKSMFFFFSINLFFLPLLRMSISNVLNNKGANMLTFKTPSRFCWEHRLLSTFSAPLGVFSQKSRKSEPWLFLEYKKTVKPQIPPDLSHFHMRNDGALYIVGGHFGPKTTLWDVKV